MIRVFYSNELERLLAPLAAAVRAASAAPLRPTTILVPNGHVAQFLKLGVARANGIAATLELPFLERYLASLAPPGLAPLGRRQLHALLAGRLDDGDLLAAEVMAPVRAYLDVARSPDEAALRRFQLAGRLATLFTDYALSRPRMLAAWASDRTVELSPQLAETERWQRTLWRALVGPDGALDQLAARTGIRYLPLPALFDLIAPAQLSAQLDASPLHVFGFSYLAPAYYRILERLAEVTEIAIYALNPCREYWEDVSPLEKDEDTPGLRLWGVAGRDHAAALNQLTGADFGDRFAEPAAPAETALGLLQRDILTRAPRRGGATAVRLEHAGVRALACTSIRRECEAIADEIWRLVRRDPALRFSDIGVFIAPSARDAYQTHLAAAFRAAGDIPYTMAEVSLARGSRVVDAIELLLALPFGSFARRELLRLVAHPCVAGRYADLDVEVWLRWVDALAIVHGADRSDHADTYIEGDRFNWDQGIKRLAMGAFMAGERSGEDRAYGLGGERYLPEETGAGHGAEAARLGLLVRSLIADARYCRSAELPLSAWSDLIAQLIATYIVPAGDDDLGELDQVLRAVGELRELDLDGRAVPYRIAFELTRAGLGGLLTNRGEILTEGVAVTTLAPMRALPFQVVFAAGLGEGGFPQVERDGPLDLRAAHRERGDVSPRERDRYCFLEAVLAARQRLFVSYVARDEQTGETLQPSPVVAELVEMLQRGYLAEPAAERLIRREPLRRYAAPRAAVEAHREAQAAELRLDLARHLGDRPFPTIDELRDALPHERWTAIAEQLALPPPPPPVVRDPTEPASISLYALREFLHCPLQATAGFALGLRRDDDDDVFERDDEPFSTAPIAAAQLLRASFLDQLEAELAGAPASAESLAACYDRRADRLALRGELPSGVFGAVDRAKHLELLATWRRSLGEPPGRYRVWRFGRARESSEVDELLPPLALALDDGTRVELYGKTEPVCSEAPSSLSLTWSKASERYQLRGYLDHAVLAAAELVPATPFSAAVAGPADGLATRRLPGLEPAAARAWLRALVADFLSGVHAYLMPCEVVFDYVGKRGAHPFDRLLAKQLAKTQPSISSAWGPVRAYAAFPAPPDADALIARRFSRFFEATT